MKRAASDSFLSGEDVTHSQNAALCWRAHNGVIEILLVTSRETGRWVIPKGWPIEGMDGARAAAREAWEEAGVRGRIEPQCVGFFSYDKVLNRNEDRSVSVPCVVSVFSIAVDRRDKRFPEKGQRRVRWFRQDKAATKVDEPDLQALIAAFAPSAPSPGD